METEFELLKLDEQLDLVADLISISNTSDYIAIKPFVTRVITTIEERNGECDVHAFIALCHLFAKYEKGIQQRKIEDYEVMFKLSTIIANVTSKLSSSLGFYTDQINQRTLEKFFEAIDNIDDAKLAHEFEHLLESLLGVLHRHSIEHLWNDSLLSKFEACVGSKRLTRLESKAKEIASKLDQRENQLYEAQKYPDIISLKEPL